MGLYIKDMKMPTNCIDCSFMVSSNDDNCVLQSDEANASFTSFEQMKATCPLIEVPPHGKLIDADAALLEGGPYEYDEWCKWALEQYLNAPTIIEAEGI